MKNIKNEINEIKKELEQWLEENQLSIYDVVLDEKYEELNDEKDSDNNDK